MPGPVRLTPRLPGPALTRSRLPLGAVVASTLGHAALLAALVAAMWWGERTATRVYTVNLIQAVPAVGLPTGTTRAPAPPAPVAPPTPARTEPVKREPPPKETVSLPDRALPDRALPPSRPLQRPPAVIRPGEKDLPAVASASERRIATLPSAPARAVSPSAEPRPAPPVPVGQPGGSAAGSGALSVDVSDFPHAWYLRQVLQKVEDRWQRQNQAAEPQDKPLVLVEIQRDGSIRPPRIEKTSGNAFYDQAALRAIADASPFPPLPQEWSRPSLRVMFRFELRPERG
jgi:protein TonB